ncbi:MAG: hypothetical protein IT440_05605 [Phycisphaeraceae bacterium]|nr:hypothetical protein [Phycisphaeraceae bacterium]
MAEQTGRTTQITRQPGRRTRTSRSLIVNLMLGLLGLLALPASPARADTINLGLDGLFTEQGPGLIFDSNGVGDRLTFTNTSDAGVRIASITLTLGPGLSYDLGGGFLSTGGFGAAPVIVHDGGSGASLVGDTLLFTQFDPGETVELTVDLDAALLQVIPGWRFALGTSADVLFTSPNFLSGPVTLQGSYAGDGLLNPDATLHVEGKAQIVPEPAAAALLVLAASVVIAWPRRRRQA